MKVSTQLFNQQQVKTFGKLTEDIQNLQAKIASGKNFVRASDDPVAAAELSALKTVSEKFNQYSKNAQSGINRLNIADSSLQAITNLMVRAREIAIQAANDTFGAIDREAMAIELDEMKKEMFSVANAVDSSGAYIFGGYHTKNAPFTKDENNRIEYNGDRGTNSVAVSETRTVGTTLDGGSVFMNVINNDEVTPMFEVLEDIIYSTRTANESVVEAKAVGTATLEVENKNPGTYQFTLKDGSGSANISVDLPGSDISGIVTAINAAGLTISAALNGNTITLTDSANGPITISDLEIEGITKAEEKPESFITFNAVDGSGNSLAKEQRLYDKNQSVQNRLDDIKAVQEHIANQRAVIGARTSSLDRQLELVSIRKIAIEEDMSDISDADLSELVTQLQSQITGLQASQQAFVKITELNLFQFIR